MPFIPAIVGAVIASVATVVSSVVAPIVASLSAAIGPALAAIGSVIGAITSAIGTAIAPVLSTVGGIAEWVVTSIGQTVSGLVETVSNAVKPFVTGLKEAIGKIAAGIDKATAPILNPIKGALEIVKVKVDAVLDWVTTAFHPSAELAELRAAHPEIWDLAQYRNDTFIFHLEEMGIITHTKAALLALPDVIETITMVSTLKVLADLIKGQASISDLLGKIADGKGFETAQAIAELSKSIVSTTVNIMDRVDTEIGILRAGIDTFDERLERTVREAIELQKAQVLALVTPKITILGRHSLMLNRKIAQVARHIEDEHWFALMFVRVLS